jgi:thiamine-phosphate pyrophosphorylase
MAGPPERLQAASPRGPFRLLAISRLETLADPGARAPAAGAGSPRSVDASASAARWFADLAAAGVDAVQLREKHLADLALYELAQAARAALPPPARLLVNGRADVALAAGADGVHLPADGVPASALRARFGKRLLIGVSTHRVEEVGRARREGADYVVFGPVYETKALAGRGAPLGPQALARAAAAAAGIPVYALGGVTLERFAEIAASGAAGIAAIRLFQRREELERAVEAGRAYFARAAHEPPPASTSGEPA